MNLVPHLFVLTWSLFAQAVGAATSEPSSVATKTISQPFVAESFVPALPFTQECQSHVTLTNLREIPVKIEVEGHSQSGGLAQVTGHASRTWIQPGEVLEFTVQLDGNNEGAWFRIREHVPASEDSPAVVVRATTGCVEGDTLITRSREVAVSLRNPWFAGRVAELQRVTMWALNVSRSAAQVEACYSSGSYYIVPGDTPKDARPMPVCSHHDEFLLAPGAAVRIPTVREGNTEFELRTEGEAIVLQALRSDVLGTHNFSVDSSITFQSAP